MTGRSVLADKYEHLKHIIRSYGCVGVAFSGGVDSTLLLHVASEVLSRDKITALHGRSTVNMSDTSAEDIYKQCFQKHAQLKIIKLNPLTHPEFVNNDSKRCYYCKKSTYSSFIKYLSSINVDCLLDGTNIDDLKEDRAGLAVLEEYSIKTPYVEAGIGKQEIRFLAKSYELPNYNMPSNSCLATRLVFTPQIDQQGLDLVEKIENNLKKMNFFGCRIKPKENSIIIELRQQDYVKLAQRHNRIAVQQMCEDFGFENVFLNICGRQ